MFENGSTAKYDDNRSLITFTTGINNNLLTENILDPGGSIVASLRFDDDQNPNTPNPYEDLYFFYNYDVRGSTTAIIRPDGTLTTGYTYDEFGNLARSGAQDFLNEVTFTGSVSDTASGLQYMNARFYNPNTGRFLSQDTYSGSAWDPWTQHLYAYCGNNPVNMIDPTGHSAWLIILGLLTAWGTAVASQPDVAYDIDFLAIDLANEDYGSAALDALGLAIPCVTGFGQIDNLVYSSIRASDKVIDT